MEIGFMHCLSVLLVAATAVALYLYSILWLRPEKLRHALRSRGITGPEPSFLFGNIGDMKISKQEERTPREETMHDYSSTFFPYIDRWREAYGPIYMFSIGSNVFLYVSDPDLVKEITLSKSLDIGKTAFSNKSFNALLGKGIIAASGHAWAIQRKTIAPEFFMHKVMGMVDIMADSALPLLKSLEEEVERGVADIKVDEQFQCYAADVLSRACFSSNYTDGKEIFSKITDLQVALPMQTMIARIPGSTYLPTRSNRVVWRLSREIRSLVLKVVKKRTDRAMEEKDLLQSILKNSTEEGLDESLVVDNCKNIYFAGQETVATTAKWVLLLLASNPQWQTRIREEVMNVCEGQTPDTEKLKKLPLLTQVIQETLRLYPASPIFARQLYGDMKFGDLRLPKGTSLWIPILHFHHDKVLWGADANQFKPERFAKGVSGACKHPHMYMPFGFGPRTCLGQNFAMVQLKIVLAMILSRYRIYSSSKHRQAVELRQILGPRHGVHLVIEKV